MKRSKIGQEFTRSARWLRAWRYATGRLKLEDGYHLMRAGQAVSGTYPLVELSSSDVLDQAVGRWGEHPDLERLVETACSRVSSKWNSPGHELGEAQSWAMEIVEEYARGDNIELVDSWSIDYDHTTQEV